jgi:flagellar motility protein MotE (MotC chaperone)
MDNHVAEPDEDWQLNYFNYFTEAEEHFQKARGTALFLLSPLDWALIETWKNSGVPLAAVLRGIDAAFEKWRSRKSKVRMVNSLAYCAQAVLEAAQQMAGAAPPRTARPAPAPFELDELRGFLGQCIRELSAKGDPAYAEIASALGQLQSEAETHYQDLEELERRLTALEDKMVAIARSRHTGEDLAAARRALDAELRPYRSKMSAPQLAMLEEQYLERRLLEAASLPRLSLFYLR